MSQVAGAALSAVDLVKKRAAGLARYLHDLVDLRWTKVRDCEKFPEVIWLAEIPQREGYACAAWARCDDHETWIAARKEPEPSPPSPPEICLPWCNAASLRDSRREPYLSEARVQGDESGRFIYLKDQPKVQEAWLVYLIEDWQPWAVRHRTWLAGQELYDHLLAAYRQQQRLAEAFEVVLGLGLLSWLTPSGQIVRRHLVVARGQLAFDAEAGRITARADPRGARVQAEWDMLEPSERPLPEQQSEIEECLSAAGEDPWDPTVRSALRRSCNAIDSHGVWSDSLAWCAKPGRGATVEFAPALILRKREQRSTLRLLAEIAAQIEAGGEVPAGFASLCTTAPASSRSGEGGPGAATGSEEQILLPLPSNEEQRRVAEALQDRRQVLVQGPPGTGKTWTIANLLCHLLAQGKRVLITSQTTRALAVLKEKLPAELQPLCVSVLGDDVRGTRDLQECVSAIVRAFHTWQELDANDRAGALERDLLETRSQRQEVLNALRDLREQETSEQVVPGTGYRGTAEAIGRRLEGEAAAYGWLCDEMPVGADPPLDPAGAGQLLALLRALPPEKIADLRRPRPDPESESLPAPADFRAWVQREQALRADCDRNAPLLAAAPASALARSPASARDDLLAVSKPFANHIAKYRAAGGWRRSCLEDALAGATARWKAQAERCAELGNELARDGAWCDARQVHLPNGCEAAVLRSDLGRLRQHLRSGGGLGWWLFRPEPVRRGLYLMREVQVDGAPPGDLAGLDALERFLAAKGRVRAAEALWSEDEPLPTRGLLAAVAGELEERGAVVAAIISETERLGAAFQMATSAVPGLGSGGADPAALVPILEALGRADELERLQAAFSRAAEVVRDSARGEATHPCCDRLLAAIDERDPPSYRTEWEEISALAADSKRLDRRNRLLCALRAAAPLVAEQLETSPEDPVWDDRVKRWNEAWAWVQGRKWLRDFSALDSGDLQSRLDELDDRDHRSTAQLAAVRAWRRCFARLRVGDTDYLQYLQAWAHEIKLIGKGTGKHAAKHRRSAQEYLDQCRPVIPAWIMPFYRVAESVRAAPGAFDVAVVDEASQSGLESLALFYMAKQVLVVGDDQQISPDNVGLDQGEVEALLRHHLGDLELRDTFAVGYSLFDHAALRAPRIVLQEHFRCMPEIIRFSTDLCYPRTPLWPLRQYSARRLAPLKVVHVPGGFREGSVQNITNRPEAEAIAEAIACCCGDPAYAGKSFGVISLQGEAQARLIERLLSNRLPAREIEDRQIICGDAYAFQGTERDIIFLSMVIANNERFQALTKDDAKRRFNVAASRARDQCWLFHSVMPADLSDADLRHQLLSYYLSPAAPSPNEVDWSRCESDFEREVGNEIAARGYRLIPQFEPFGSGSYRIDFVVDAGANRLAVECDGDRWHGPDRHEQDMYRQRQLERAGWRFWRVRASAFYRDRQAAMSSLWEELDGESPPVVGVAAQAVPGIDFSIALNAEAALSQDSERDEGAPVSPSARALGPRHAVLQALAAGPMAREHLLRAVSAALGYRRLGRVIRQRLNRQIGAELRAGRIYAAGDVLVLGQSARDPGGPAPDGDSD